MQVSKSFDPVTLGKIKRSALISLSGFLAAAIPLLIPAVQEMLRDHPTVAAFIGVTGAFLVNAIREYMKGE